MAPVPLGRSGTTPPWASSRPSSEAVSNQKLQSLVEIDRAHALMNGVARGRRQINETKAALAPIRRRRVMRWNLARIEHLFLPGADRNPAQRFDRPALEAQHRRLGAFQ